MLMRLIEIQWWWIDVYSDCVTESSSGHDWNVGPARNPGRSQVGRTLTTADEGVQVGHRVLICDRDAKWSEAVRSLLKEAGIQVVQTPFQAPNANAHAERFVRSIKAECLDCVIPRLHRSPWPTRPASHATFAVNLSRPHRSLEEPRRAAGRRPLTESVASALARGIHDRPRALHAASAARTST
jgi:transposase InsO family protein